MHYPSGRALCCAGSRREELPLLLLGRGNPDLSRLTELQYPDPEVLVDGWALGLLTGAAAPLTLGLLEAMTQVIQKICAMPIAMPKARRLQRDRWRWAAETPTNLFLG